MNQKVLRWFFFWFLGWGIFYLSVSLGLTYLGNPLLTGLLYFTLAFLGVYIFRKDLKEVVNRPSPLSLALLIVLVFVLHIAYIFPESTKSIFLWTDINAKLFISLPFDLLFQQVMIASLVGIMYNEKKSIDHRLVHFAFLFFLAHTPLIFLIPIKWAILFTIFSSLGGLIFGFLILRFRSGYIYSYIVHLTFYMAIFEVFRQFIL